MDYFGIEYSIKNMPELDPDFIPFAAVKRAYEEEADGEEIAIALERSDAISVHKLRLHSEKKYHEADRHYIERFFKFLLWMKGGYKAVIYGSKEVAEHISGIYSMSGKRRFDADFMAKVYEREKFEVEFLPLSECPEENDSGKKVGSSLKGCRIGFDAGGSDRKVSAVVDGKAVFSEEVIWYPKLQDNPDYHFREIVSAFKKAASHMPRVDAIGVSSAGVYVNNRCMIASLFLNVKDNKFQKDIKDIYINAAKRIGNIPMVVCNDGDVAALAGAMGLEDNNVVGIAMGTSLAAGYIDEKGRVKGWLNELHFAPVDLNLKAPPDSWSGDIGVGTTYFCQDGVIRLGEKINIIFKRGHTAAMYHDMYRMKHILLMGRVVSGKGGELIISEAQKVLSEDYPDITVNMTLPDEKARRVGQAFAAASLPELDK